MCIMVSLQQTLIDSGTHSGTTLTLSRDAGFDPLRPDERLAILAAALNATGEGIAIFDTDLQCLQANFGFACLYGKAPQAFEGRMLEEVLPLQGRRLSLELERSLHAGFAVSSEISLARPGSPETRTYLRTCQPLRSPTGKILGVVAIVTDVTERRRADAALLETWQETQHLAELNSCLQWTSDARGLFFQMRDRRVASTSRDGGDGAPASWLEALDPEDEPSIRALWRHSVETGDLFEAECRMRSPGGAFRWVRGRALCRRNDQGVIVQWLGMFEDIHDRKQTEEDLREKTRRLEAATRQLALLVRKDHLTGLGNRRHFDRTLQREVRRAHSSGLPLALLMLDVDQFKHYNDHYGHVAGDLCLRRIGEALQRITRSREDLVARYGGEEFAIVLPNTSEAQALEIATRAIREVRTMGLEHSGRPGGRVTLSAGGAMLGARSQDQPETVAALASNLIRLADLALYSAKREGRDRAATARSIAQLVSSQLPVAAVDLQEQTSGADGETVSAR